MKLNVLILTYNLMPEFGGGTTMHYELAKYLVQAGHQVTVVTYAFKNPKNGKKDPLPPLEEVIDGIHIKRTRIPYKTKSSLILRQISNTFTDLLLVIKALSVKPVDIIFLGSPPITLPLFGAIIKRIRKAKLVLYLQDIFPEFLISMNVLTRGNPLFKAAKVVEKAAYKGVDYIGVHSPKNRKYVISRGVDANKVNVMPLWVDTNFIAALPKENKFLLENHLEHKFVVLYAGNVGMAMGATTIPQAAKLLENEKDIQLVVVGSGSRYGELAEETHRLGIKNLLLFPPKPREELPEVLASCNVLLVMLRKELSHNPNGYFMAVIPHKMLSNMASGKPILLTAEADSDAANLVRIANCGITVDPEDPKALAQAIINMKQDKAHLKTWGENGLKFAREQFDSSKQVRRMEELFIHLKMNSPYEFNDPWFE